MITVPLPPAWTGVPVGTAMSMPGWQFSHERDSQKGEVIGPLTGQTKRPLPLTAPPEVAVLVGFCAAWMRFWIFDCCDSSALMSSCSSPALPRTLLSSARFPARTRSIASRLPSTAMRARATSLRRA